MEESPVSKTAVVVGSGISTGTATGRRSATATATSPVKSLGSRPRRVEWVGLVVLISVIGVLAMVGL